MRRAILPNAGLALLFLLAPRLSGETPIPGHPKDPRVVDKKAPDLTGFHTVDSAIVARISRAATLQAKQPGYLGIHVEVGKGSRLTIAAVEPQSAADIGGLKAGDILLQINGHSVTEPDQVAELLRANGAGETVTVQVERAGKLETGKCVLIPVSRLLNADGTSRTSVGFRAADNQDTVKVESVEKESPAAAAGVKEGDVILQIDDKKIKKSSDVGDAIANKQAGQSVALILKREGKELGLAVKLTSAVISERPRNYDAWDIRGNRLFKKPVYRLAVVQLSYPDVKPNPQIAPGDWEQALFSRGTFLNKNATGQQVYGSLNDYYLEQSCGKLSVSGKVFDWVQVARKRDDYGTDRNRFALLNEGLDKLLAREGEHALDGFDGIYFIYAGARVQTNRGSLYWPHRSMMGYRGKRWDYYICPEGGRVMDSISVLTHEFGHMLGLPDLYARPETPGAIGLGIWCTMATGHGRDGKPMHFSPWCKEQMGWLDPVVIDPTVKQKLVLAPIEFSPKECLKVLIRSDGSEYLLLEVRSQNNCGRDLPQPGLLIWRIVDGRPLLEESHGIGGADGPGRFLTQIPYPSGVNNAFTPYTTPSSRSLKGGGLPVHITNITRLPDGRVSFFIGYEFF